MKASRLKPSKSGWVLLVRLFKPVTPFSVSINSCLMMDWQPVERGLNSHKFIKHLESWISVS